MSRAGAGGKPAGASGSGAGQADGTTASDSTPASDGSPADGLAAAGDGTAAGAGIAAPGDGIAAPGDGVAADVAPGRSSGADWDPVVRVVGLAVAILAAFLSGVFELLLTTLRADDFATIWRGDAIGSGGGPLIPVSILLAIGLNYAIAWFAVSTTRRRWALGPPWALWTLLMFAASGVRTSEGDYLLSGSNWVALVTILTGSLSFAVYSYRMILKRVKP